jgi:hypothetical protein
VRLAAAIPTSLPSDRAIDTWTIIAAPAPSVLPVGIALASIRAEHDPNMASTEWDHDIVHGNPFLGHAVSGVVSTVRLRSVSLPGDTALPMTLETSTVYTSNGERSCPDVDPLLDPVEIAGQITLGDVPLETDNIDIAADPEQPEQPIVLTWSDIAPGSASLYAVTLHHVISFFGYVAPIPERIFVTNERMITIAPELLEPDNTYVLEIETRTGFSGAISGDLGPFDHPSSPYATSTAWSSTFVRR